MKPLLLANAFAVILCPAYGQLYLIQGSPTPKSSGGYGISLLRVGADGSVQRASEILPGGPKGGAQWIGTSYEHRKAVFLPKYPSQAVVVLDLDAASVVKKCDTPPAPMGMTAFPFDEWLADIPGKGLVYAERYGTADDRKLDNGKLAARRRCRACNACGSVRVL